ncbi:Etk tyrosine kinase [Clostridia bacterium]|nr:Etk tyrosine kinase [Clostridia bacterium]
MANIEKSSSNYNENSMSVDEFSLIFLSGLKKYGWTIIVFALLGAILNVSYVYFNFNPLYSANATFTVSANIAKESTSYYNSNTAKQMAKTFPYILTSNALSHVVAKDLRLTYMPGTVTAKAVTDTNLFTITVTSNDYETAYKVLKSVIKNYPSIARPIIGNTQITLISPPAYSTTPINKPVYKTITVTGSILGAAAGLILTIFLAILNTTIKSAKELEKTIRCFKLGVIVKVYRKKSKKVKSSPYILITNKSTDPRFTESISSIRNNIVKKCADNKLKSILVTSTGPNEGKTTISVNLALALAKKHYKTIILDCDLRNPSIKNQLEITDKVHTIDHVIMGKCSLADAILKVPDSNLYALLGANRCSNASELISSKPFQTILSSLHETFDYIILDAPPAGIISDASALKDDVDGLVFVVRHDYAKAKRISDTVDLFENSKIRVLGYVFNRATGVFGNRSYGRYGYGYGYDYGSADGTDAKKEVPRYKTKQ